MKLITEIPTETHASFPLFLKTKNTPHAPEKVETMVWNGVQQPEITILMENGDFVPTKVSNIA